MKQSWLKDVAVDPSARVSREARLAGGVVIGPGTLVEAGAELGEGVVLEGNVVVRAGTRIARGCTVGFGSILGQVPSHAKTSTLVSSPLKPLIVGEECQVGLGVVIYAGTQLGPGCFLADGAQVRERCVLGRNVIVGHNATVENDCRIGDRSKLQTGVYLTAYSTLAEDVFLAPMVTTSNDNFVGRTAERFQHRRGATVERGGRVGANATLLPGVVIGQEALVAAGSVVTRDVPPYKVAMGVPARVVREVPAEQLLYPRA